MTENLLLIAATYIIAREIFFFYQVHKLINKLMSRNYWEYERAKLPQAATAKPAVAVANIPEDLARIL